MTRKEENKVKAIILVQESAIRFAYREGIMINEIGKKRQSVSIGHYEIRFRGSNGNVGIVRMIIFSILHESLKIKQYDIAKMYATSASAVSRMISQCNSYEKRKGLYKEIFCAKERIDNELRKRRLI